ncbi:MAG TPA: shikimate kinase [Tepidisphaeraceae bacterium]
MSIVLIGYRGSGKSTIGKRLADKLWQPFFDTDEAIVAKAGKSIAEIFAQDGEPAFREIESQVIQEAAKLQEHVIAIGGGALLREENRRMLKDGGHRLIYLKCEPTTLHQRIQSDPNTAGSRPNLTALGGGVAEIDKLLAEREPIYREAMDAELDVSNLSPDEAVVYIVRLL